MNAEPKVGPPTLTFIHRFGGGVVCEFTVVDRPPLPGSTFQREMTWTGRLKPKHVPEYRQWILVTTQTLCDRWQKTILYALGVAPRLTELWVFTPGQAPKLEEKLPYGLP